MVKIKLFETFSGIGAQHKALTNLKNNIGLDFDVIATSDWAVYPVMAYANIHYPGYKVEATKEEINKFIHEFDLSRDTKVPILNKAKINDLEKEQWYKAFKVTKNIGSIVDIYPRYKKLKVKPNVLTYSFPCQDLSTAGNFHGFNDGIREGTRSGLLLEIEKLIKHLDENKETLPKYLLLENVNNLVSKQHIKDYDRWLDYLSSIGYSTSWSIVNSFDFYTIQKRRRVYALSVLDGKGTIDKNLNQRLLDLKDEYTPGYNKQTKISQIIDFPNKKKSHGIWESEWAQIKNTPSRIRMIDTGLDITNKLISLPTVTTKQDRLPNVGSVEFINERSDKDGVPYTNRRFIQPRESYLMMGFSEDDYKNAKKAMLLSAKSGKRSTTFAREKLYKQGGNSIVVNVLEYIFYLISKEW